MRAVERHSFMRAAAAAFVGHRDREDPVKVLRRSWASDDSAERVLRAATAPTGTADYPAAQSNVVLPLLAPSGASARLLALAMVGRARAARASDSSPRQPRADEGGPPKLRQRTPERHDHRLRSRIALRKA
jgi:hypothetical protein